MYMPILKNRSIEMKVLKDLLQIGISNKIIPVIEIIQEKTRNNSKIDIFQELKSMYHRQDNLLLVDIIKRRVGNSTNEIVRKFVSKVNRENDVALNMYENFISSKNIIPVISENPDNFNLSNFEYNSIYLRNIGFTRLAFRITPTNFDKVFIIIKKHISQNDFLIFDIASSSHMNPIYKKLYKKINTLKASKNFLSFIVNSPKPNDLTNISLIDGQPIFEIDNSLLELYNSRSHNFDGFGDYAGVTNELPGTGGTISPAGIYYSFENNFFIGYRRNRTLSEFKNYIAPKIMQSDYWKEFSTEHHEKCPGCSTITKICNGTINGNSQGKWKGITMSHYIYSISELLFN